MSWRAFLAKILRTARAKVTAARHYPAQHQANTTMNFRTMSAPAVVATLIHSSAGAGIPIARIDFDLEAILSDRMAALTESNVLRASNRTFEGAEASCQPLKGDRVLIAATEAHSTGIPRASAARVFVIDGRCKGEEGWVLLFHLQDSAKGSSASQQLGN